MDSCQMTVGKGLSGRDTAAHYRIKERKVSPRSYDFISGLVSSGCYSKNTIAWVT